MIKWGAQMKVLMINTVELGKNGISTCILNYSETLRNDGAAVDIAAPNIVEQEVRDRIRKCGAALYELPFRNTSTLLYWNKLKKIIKKGKYDIVHVHGNSATMTVELSAAFVSGCKIRIAHSHNTTCEHQKAHRLLLPFFKALCTHGAACGVKAGEWLFKDKDFKVIRNGIDIEKYSYSDKKRKICRDKYGLSPEAIVIGHVGIFNYQKNHEFLVKIFSGLQRSSDAYRLFLVGDGELRENTERLAEQLRVRDKIVFAGNEENVSESLSAMDLFVMPSRFEGLPFVLVEAQASGLPCIVSSAVTAEADLTGLVSYIAGFDEAVWVENIMKSPYGHSVMDSEVLRNTLREKGYDIQFNGGILRNFYRACMEEKLR